MDIQQRNDNFKRIKEDLEKQGYQTESCTISVLKANAMAFVIALPIILLMCIVFALIRKSGGMDFTRAGLIVFYGGLFGSIVVHEYLHGITWSLFCQKGWKSIHIGVMWRKLTPYCCCMEPLNFKNYLMGGLMPFLILGMGMFVVALVTGSITWLVLSIFNVLAAGGDLTIAVLLLKHRKDLIMDHPIECGFWAFYKKYK